MAVELQPNKVLRDRFDQGAQVEGIARTYIRKASPLPCPPTRSPSGSKKRTRAMANGATAIFEATFVADNTRIDVDILARRWRRLAADRGEADVVREGGAHPRCGDAAPRGDEEGCRLASWSNESREPPHMHVFKGGAASQWWLTPLEEAYSIGLNPA